MTSHLERKRDAARRRAHEIAASVGNRTVVERVECSTCHTTFDVWGGPAGLLAHTRVRHGRRTTRIEFQHTVYVPVVTKAAA